jgi:hypothetical protein
MGTEFSLFGVVWALVTVPFLLAYTIGWNPLEMITFDILKLGPYLPIEF